MTNPVEAKYLNRVRALLAKAEATEFPAEAEELTAKAIELMSKHGIDAAHLRAQDSSAEPIHDQVAITNPRAKARAHLLNTVAEGMGCKMLLAHPKRSMAGTAHLFGFPDDIERVKLMYTSLLMQLESALKRVEVPMSEQYTAYRNSWAMGYIARIQDRMKAAKKTSSAEASGPDGSFALMLADQSRAVTARMREEFPNHGQTRTRSSSAGLGAGYTAGGRADIGNTRVNGRRAIGS